MDIEYDRYMRERTIERQRCEELLEHLMNSNDTSRYDDVYDLYTLDHRVPDDTVMRWLARDMTTREDIQKMLDTIDRCMVYRHDGVCLHVLDVYSLTIETGVCRFADVQQYVEDVVAEYGNDAHLGYSYFKQTVRMVSLDSSINTTERYKMCKDLHLKASRMLYVSYDELLADVLVYKDTDDVYATILDRIRSNQALMAEVRGEEVLREGMSDSSKYEYVKGLLAKIDTAEREKHAASRGLVEYARYVFDFILSMDDGLRDMWKLYIRFIGKHFSEEHSVRYKVLRRSIRCLREDSTVYSEMMVAYYTMCVGRYDRAECMDRIRYIHRYIHNTARNTSVLVYSTYYRLLIHSTVASGEEEEYFDQLEYLYTTLQHVNSSYPVLSHDDRYVVCGMYRSYVSYMMRLESDARDNDHVVSVCEMMVKTCGNEEDVWTFYINTLMMVSGVKMGNDGIVNVFKRSIRFCKGNIEKLFEAYKEYHMMYNFSNRKDMEDVSSIYSSMVQKNRERGTVV